MSPALEARNMSGKHTYFSGGLLFSGAFEALEWLTNGDESVCIPLHASGMGSDAVQRRDASA